MILVHLYVLRLKSSKYRKPTLQGIYSISPLASCLLIEIGFFFQEVGFRELTCLIRICEHRTLVKNRVKLVE